MDNLNLLLQGFADVLTPLNLLVAFLGVLIGTGVGAKRIIASTADRDRADVERAIVTGRLTVGYAF